MAKEKKPHRYLPGTVARRQVTKEQRRTDTVIGKRKFQRLTRDVVSELLKKDDSLRSVLDTYKLEDGDIKFYADSLHVLQLASEARLISLLEDANECVIHAKRKTLLKKDVSLASSIYESRHT